MYTHDFYRLQLIAARQRYDDAYLFVTTKRFIRRIIAIGVEERFLRKLHNSAVISSALKTLDHETYLYYFFSIFCRVKVECSYKRMR